MDTHKAIAELSHWAEAAANGKLDEAAHHARQFYHIGSSLAASKEFQAAWRARHGLRLEPERIEEAYKLLSLIAQLEASQLSLSGKIAA